MVNRASPLRKALLTTAVAVFAILAVLGMNTVARYDGPEFARAQVGSPIAVESATPDVPTETATATATIPEETNTPVIEEPTLTPTATATVDPCDVAGLAKHADPCETPVATATATFDPDEGEPTVDPTIQIVETEEPIVELPNTGAGSTAPEVKASNHVASGHYITSGCFYGWYQSLYGTAYLYDPVWNRHSFYNTYLLNHWYRC